jgi:hypothetical protein
MILLGLFICPIDPSDFEVDYDSEFKFWWNATLNMNTKHEVNKIK